MIYGSCYFNLGAPVKREERAKLAAKIRKFKYILSVAVEERRIHIVYNKIIPQTYLYKIQRMLTEIMKEQKEASVTPAERLAEYRRDAIISVSIL